MKAFYTGCVLVFITIMFNASCKKDDDNDTESILPVVSTLSVTSVKADSAVFSASVVSEGQSAVIKRGFCWSKVPNPTVSDSMSENAFGPGVFLHNADMLTSNTIYFVRAYATNGQGTAYGNELIFKTKYKIGDPGPAGGIVFYIDASGGGLEAAPSITESVTEWGCMGNLLTSTSTALGTGQANTTVIITNCGVVSIAARLCDDLAVNGFSDWYLPSKDELNLMYTNLASAGLGNFTGYRYWSSSEENANSTWWQDMALGNQAATSKSNIYRVRAVRSL